jgi:hypothetical protein
MLTWILCQRTIPCISWGSAVGKRAYAHFVTECSEGEVIHNVTTGRRQYGYFRSKGSD